MVTTNRNLKKIYRCLAGPIFLLSIMPNGNAQTNNIKSQTIFDTAAARIIVEKRCNAFEKALKERDSIAVGDIYTLDTKIIGSYPGRNNIIKEAHEMAQDSITGIKFRIINLWGSDNIIVEDAYVDFFHENGTQVGKGNCMLVWKKEDDKWRIFRDVFKPDKK